MEASAREGEGAGRGPGGLRNSEQGPLPHSLKQNFQKTKQFFFSGLFFSYFSKKGFNRGDLEL
jgi:hypothetical protein